MPESDGSPGHALTDQHDAFCRAYAATGNGAQAARLAGYAPANAASQACRLLQRPEIAERVGELQADAAAERADVLKSLFDKLEPAYDWGVEARDADVLLQVVELQARIAGLVHGGATVRPRGARAGATPEPTRSHEDWLDSLG